jgi:23S rRNA pseudouridine2605 synthase
MASPKTKKTVTKKPVTKKSVTKKPVIKKTVKSKKSAPRKPKAIEPELAAAPEAEALKIEDPIGDETDGEAETANETGNEAEAEIAPEAAAEPEFAPEPRPPAKLERLQKILAAAGVASRRSAEAMIEQGRVQVNGKVVTVLGSKADAAHDHIRVDGKLLQGPERHRYFVLNKPRGFVTTVKDPEGRPTVMQFFSKFSERLYPVGRLDYMSEGLLVVTNDGELANRLTKASSGVEKTYLVKVAGQPTEAELNILRGGVAIERGKPGSEQVRTSPARIRQVRQGDNPWYEVVLIEGRNRELRKMFEEVGHFVEKIRRVGYGPLVLDQEPGSLRELQPAELDALRKAAEGKLRTPKSKDLRRRNLMDAGQLPTVLPKPSSRLSTARPPARFAAASTGENRPAPTRPGDFRPTKFATGRTSEFRPNKFGKDRPTRPVDSFASGEANKFFRPARPSGEDRPFSAKPAWKKPERTARSTGEKFRPVAGRSFDRPPARPASSPAWKKDERPNRPPARFAAGSSGTGRPFSPKPAWKKPERPEHSARPTYQRPAAPRREAPVRAARVLDEDLGPVRPPNLHIEEISGPERSSTTRPSAPRASYSRPGFARPAQSEGGQSRPFTTSSGKPRAGGARPSSKPFKPASGPRAGSNSRPNYGAKRPYGTKPSSSRPFTPRTEGASSYRPTKAKPYPNSASRAERKAGPGWKLKSGSAGKPAFGSRSKPKSGAPADRSRSGGWKSGYKAKPGGAKRFGGKPGGKKRD